jgi:RNA 2',3'-cyclic 3'-phosphodiesterase
MPRLFTAIELPEQVRMHLSLLRGPLTRARWVAPENMHLTIRFFGDITNHEADEVAAHLAELELEPPTIRITGTGAFGGSHPHVVYGAVETNPALDGLYRANERVARMAGLPADSHGFTAHVTLARCKGERPRAVAQFLEESGGLRVEPFTPSRFVLMSSRDGTGGGPYVVEEAYPFST